MCSFILDELSQLHSPFWGILYNHITTFFNAPVDLWLYLSSIILEHIACSWSPPAYSNWSTTSMWTDWALKNDLCGISMWTDLLEIHTMYDSSHGQVASIGTNVWVGMWTTCRQDFVLIRKSRKKLIVFSRLMTLIDLFWYLSAN
jgi:hypothetical protein